MEQKLGLISSSITLIFWIIVKIIIINRNELENVYFTIVPFILLVLSILLGICIYKRIFAKKLLKWLEFALGCIIIIALFVDILFFKMQ